MFDHVVVDDDDVVVSAAGRFLLDGESMVREYHTQRAQPHKETMKYGVAKGADTYWGPSPRGPALSFPPILSITITIQTQLARSITNSAIGGQAHMYPQKRTPQTHNTKSINTTVWLLLLRFAEWSIN